MGVCETSAAGAHVPLSSFCSRTAKRTRVTSDAIPIWVHSSVCLSAHKTTSNHPLSTLNIIRTRACVSCVRRALQPSTEVGRWERVIYRSRRVQPSPSLLHCCRLQLNAVHTREIVLSVSSRSMCAGTRCIECPVWTVHCGQCPVDAHQWIVCEIWLK